MKITLGQLRALVKETKIGASDSYMKKELVRERLQQMIVDMVRSGEIADQQSLDDFIVSVDMSAKALKMVPFDVFKKMP